MNAVQLDVLNTLGKLLDFPGHWFRLLNLVELLGYLFTQWKHIKTRLSSQLTMQMGFPEWPSGKESVSQCRRQEMAV